MFESVPAAFQYVILGETALIATLVFLWCVNRVQARRKRVGELSDRLTEWGLTKLAEPLDAYSHGDYSETVTKFIALAKEMQTTTGAASLFETAAGKIVAYYAASNATKAKEILEILKGGAASKSLFETSTTSTATTTTAATTAAS